MRILVLAHALRAAGGRVVGTNLIDQFRKREREHQFLFLVPDQMEYRNLKIEDGPHEVYYYQRQFGHLGRLIFDTYTLKRIVKSFRPDAILGLGNQGLNKPDCRQAILLHHAHLVYDSRNSGRLSFIDQLQYGLLKRNLRRQSSVADLFFCQTQAMERRLRSAYGYAGKTVITENVISSFSALQPTGKTPASLTRHRDKYKMFYLTRYYAHKGLEILVETMDRYREDLDDAVAVITIAPDQHPNAARLLEAIRKRGLEDRIINAGPLRQDELADYFTACDCLVMPTRLESFSGTYLEAMHFGLPILTSDLDFAREVCGDAALYFDPWSAESIKDTIVRVRDDSELAKALVAKGRKRLATGFRRTWEDIAQVMLDNLEELVAEKQTTGSEQ